MTFDTQNLRNYCDTRVEVSEIFREEGIKARRTISFEEAIVMQAAAHLISEQDFFTGPEILRLINANRGGIYPTLRRFEAVYGITVSSPEDLSLSGKRMGGPRREYRATEFGKRIFGIIAPEE